MSDELELERDLYKDALDHIMRVARNSLQPTRRLDFIVARAKQALDGKPFDLHDLPRLPRNRFARLENENAELRLQAQDLIRKLNCEKEELGLENMVLRERINVWVRRWMRTVRFCLNQRRKRQIALKGNAELRQKLEQAKSEQRKKNIETVMSFRQEKIGRPSCTSRDSANDVLVDRIIYAIERGE